MSQLKLTRNKIQYNNKIHYMDKLKNNIIKYFEVA